MRWLMRLFASSNDLGKLEKAIEKAAKDKAVGWYEVNNIKAHKENPITEYHVDLDPTSPPPP